MDDELSNEVSAIRLSRGKTRKMSVKCAYRVFVSKMLGGKLGNAYIPQPIVRDNLAVFVDQLGQKSVYKVSKNGVVGRKSKDFLISCLSYSAERLRKNAPKDELGVFQLRDFNFGTDDFKKIAQEFLDSAPYMKTSEIVAVRQKSDPGFYCYKRVDWDESPGACPLWEEVISRIPDKRQVMQLETWLGALFEPGTKIQQMLWWHGPGRDGKGSTAEMLHSYFGPSGGSVAASNHKLGREAGLTFSTCRFVTISECQNVDVVNDPLVKGITGGDGIQVRRLYQEGTREKPDTALLVMSNQRPEISWDPSLERRLIYVEFEPEMREVQDVTFASRLKNELPHLIYRWRQAWRDNQIMGCVPTHSAAIRSLSEQTTDYEYDLIVNKFEIGITQKMPCAEFYHHYERYAAENVDNKTRKILRAVLIKRLGITAAQASVDGKSQKCFIGISAGGYIVTQLPEIT
jgi:hypothetical protein